MVACADAVIQCLHNLILQKKYRKFHNFNQLLTEVNAEYNLELSTDAQAEILSYESEKWEFPKEHLKFGMVFF